MNFQLRVNYPHSIWGKMRTLLHRNILRCRIATIKQPEGGLVVFDDTCRQAWWS